MILAEACLASLNQELSLPLEMERFRPNIVVNGLNAFEEVSFLTNQFSPYLFIAVVIKSS